MSAATAYAIVLPDLPSLACARPPMLSLGRASSSLRRTRGGGGTTLAGSIHFTLPGVGAIATTGCDGRAGGAGGAGGACVSSSGIGVGRRTSGIGDGGVRPLGGVGAPGGRVGRAPSGAAIPASALALVTSTDA